MAKRSQKRSQECDVLLILAQADAAALDISQQRYFPSLPDVQQRYIGNFLRKEDRILRFLVRFLAAHGLHYLTGETLTAILGRIRQDACGRPVLDGGTWELSFSHCYPWAVCLLGRAYRTGRIGIDIERKRFLDRGVWEQICTDDELLLLADCGFPMDLTTETWTAKEAVLKLHGTGFFTDPKTICLAHLPVFQPYPDMALMFFSGLPDFSVTVAVEHAATPDILSLVNGRCSLVVSGATTETDQGVPPLVVRRRHFGYGDVRLPSRQPIK